jgi:hypothetical protein
MFGPTGILRTYGEPLPLVTGNRAIAAFAPALAMFLDTATR